MNRWTFLLDREISYMIDEIYVNNFYRVVIKVIILFVPILPTYDFNR